MNSTSTFIFYLDVQKTLRKTTSSTTNWAIMIKDRTSCGARRRTWNKKPLNSVIFSKLCYSNRCYCKFSKSLINIPRMNKLNYLEKFDLVVQFLKTWFNKDKEQIEHEENHELFSQRKSFHDNSAWSCVQCTASFPVGLFAQSRRKW